MSERELGRRRVLAAAGTGLATGLAGCGYHPGGGEFEWERTVRGTSMSPRSTTQDEGWYGDGECLYRIRNREGEAFTIDGTVDLDNADVTAYDSSGEIAWRAKAQRQYQGSPAVANGTVYLHLEDGSVIALEAGDEDDGESEDSLDDDGPVTWETDFDGSPLTMIADERLVVGVGEDEVVAFDATTGERRFTFGGGSTDATDVIDTEAIGTGDTVDDTLDAVAIAGGRAWLLVDDELYGLDGDGTTAVERSLPAPGAQVTATDAGAVVTTEQEVWVVDSNDELTLTAEFGGNRSSTVVGARDRVYHIGLDTLTAIDVDEGTVAWTSEDYSFRGDPAADADGVYGQRNNSDQGGCEMFAVTSDGEMWWRVPSYDDLGCDEERFLVGDRLVVFDGATLYGFRKAPGSRLSVL